MIQLLQIPPFVIVKWTLLLHQNVVATSKKTHTQPIALDRIIILINSDLKKKFKVRAFSSKKAFPGTFYFKKMIGIFQKKSKKKF